MFAVRLRFALSMAFCAPPGAVTSEALRRADRLRTRFLSATYHHIPMASLSVGVVLDLPAEHRYHGATLAAIEHAAAALELGLELRVLPSDTLIRTPLRHDALVIGPGSPYRDPEAVLIAIRAAREQGIPLVGT